ncbi:MAG: ammonium transporter [Alphaproteobacteria bacterium]|nr:ammonium transporter [Alphaproteobacteria bacterium]
MGTIPSRVVYFVSIVAILIAFPDIALAQDAAKFSAADTAWILTATALVLFMTLPGLALFYGGLVRSRNVLSVLMHCFVICCAVSVVWLAVGYSLAFSDGGSANQYIGGLSKAFLAGVGTDTLSGSIPEIVFFMFQMTFAIITPALIVGAYPERITFLGMLLFSVFWLLLVYVPVTHWIWGGGWLAEMGVMDFAGGLVVHLTAGVSALVIAVMVGSRRGFPREVNPPHNPGMVMIGAAMLWVGWFGFNGGSALGANGGAGMAIAVTHISAAVASLTWMMIEWIKHGKPSLIGFVTGTIAGLPTITPASGFVGPMGAVILGVAAGLICYGMVHVIKQRFQIDDSLDVFAVHGVGGLTGTILVAFLALPAFGGLGLAKGVTAGDQLWVQFVGAAATAAWAIIASVIIIWIIRLVTPMRVSEEDETEGLDITSHGERGYNF